MGSPDPRGATWWLRYRVDPATRVRGERHHMFWITDAVIADIKTRRLRGERVMDIAKHHDASASLVSTILHDRYRRGAA